MHKINMFQLLSFFEVIKKIECSDDFILFFVEADLPWFFI